MQFIENLTKEELITLASLVTFGAAITIQQDDELKTSIELQIAEAIEELNTDDCLDDSKQIVDLAIKFKEYIENKATNKEIS